MDIGWLSGAPDGRVRAEAAQPVPDERGPVVNPVCFSGTDRGWERCRPPAWMPGGRGRMGWWLRLRAAGGVSGGWHHSQNQPSLPWACRSAIPASSRRILRLANIAGFVVSYIRADGGDSARGRRAHLFVPEAVAAIRRPEEPFHALVQPRSRSPVSMSSSVRTWLAGCGWPGRWITNRSLRPVPSAPTPSRPIDLLVQRAQRCVRRWSGRPIPGRAALEDSVCGLC
jgi:hypothetical protein